MQNKRRGPWPPRWRSSIGSWPTPDVRLSDDCRDPWHAEDVRSIPIGACSLDDEALAERAERWRSEIGPAVLSREAVAGGMVTRLRRSPALAQDLRELVRLEAECCPHLDFRIAEEDTELRLKVSFASAAPA